MSPEERGTHRSAAAKENRSRPRHCGRLQLQPARIPEGFLDAELGRVAQERRSEGVCHVPCLPIGHEAIDHHLLQDPFGPKSAWYTAASATGTAHSFLF